MLAEEGGGPVDEPRRFRKPPGRARIPERPRLGVVDLDEEAPRRQLRAGRDPRGVAHHGEGNAPLPADPEKLVRGPLLEPRLQKGVHFVGVFPPHESPVLIAGIPRPRRIAHGLDEPLPRVARARDHAEVAVPARQDGVGIIAARAGGAVPLAPPRDPLRRVHRGGDPAVERDNVGGGNVHVLAVPAPRAREARQEEADGAVHAPLVIGLGDRQRQRRAPGLADRDAGGAGRRGLERVAAKPGVGTAAAERRDGHVDEARPAPPRLLGGQAERLEPLDGKILHQAVGGLEQGAQAGGAGGRLKVERHAALASVERQEEAAPLGVGLVAGKRAVAAGGVTLGCFDFDDVSPQTRQEPAAVRGRDELAQLDDPEA